MRLAEFTERQQALGSDVELSIVAPKDIQSVKDIFNQLWSMVFNFERQFSRFLTLSELSAFNRSAGLKTPISDEFKDLLTAAKQMGIKTDGLYNPFILPALQRAGYNRSAVEGYENDVLDDYTNKQVVSVDKLEIGDSWASIPYGTALDMGGCGKGYLADRLGDKLIDLGVQGFWLSLGGDITTYGIDENGENISISIQDANNLESTLAWVIECPETRFSIATSGTFKRKSQQTDKNWHHLIDPRTMLPATTDVRLATVCAESSVYSDVLASCAVILGSNKAMNYLNKHQASVVFLQCNDSSGKVFEQKSDSKYLREVVRNV